MAPSDKQIDFLNSLLNDRQVGDSLRVEAEAVREHGDRRDVSAMIERLKGCPYNGQGRQHRAGVEVRVTEPGVYRLNGDVFIVKPNREKTKLYAKRLVETGATERLTESGDVIYGVEFEYAPGAIYRLSPEDRMPFEDAKALTIRYAKCIVCGRSLKAAESVERGIGPVCRGYFPDAGITVGAPLADTPPPEAIEWEQGDAACRAREVREARAADEALGRALEGREPAHDVDFSVV